VILTCWKLVVGLPGSSKLNNSIVWAFNARNPGSLMTEMNQDSHGIAIEWTRESWMTLRRRKMKGRERERAGSVLSSFGGRPR